MNFRRVFVVGQVDVFIVIVILSKIEDPAVLFEAVILDVYLEGRGSPPLPFANADVVVGAIEADASGGTGSSVTRGDEVSSYTVRD